MLERSAPVSLFHAMDLQADFFAQKIPMGNSVAAKLQALFVFAPFREQSSADSWEYQL